MDKFKLHENVLVFDDLDWQENGDIDDNAIYYKPAMIVGVHTRMGVNNSLEQLFDVQFVHDGRISTGHSLSSLKKAASLEPELEPHMLNDYGKQLYWMCEGMYSVCADLMRSFERADGKHDKEDQQLREIVEYIRYRAKNADTTLKRLAIRNRPGYEVLKPEFVMKSKMKDE